MDTHDHYSSVKKTILLFTDWYEPGYKAGGPIRSCVNFVQQMKEDYSIFIFTTDRDLDATTPYPGVVVDQWTTQEKNVQIFYASPGFLSWKNIRQQLKIVHPDFIYLNSMFSRFFTIYPLLQAGKGQLPGKIILAPRGMLKQSALQFKQQKKTIYLSLFKWLGLHKGIRFHVTDSTESADVRRQFGESASTHLVSNFPGSVTDYPGSLSKKPGMVSIIFVGRIHPIKNLDYLLEILPQLTGNISLTVVGNEEDQAFAQHCKNLADKFPATITVDFAGEIPNHQLGALIAQHHIFALPTRGENFGHAIFEALRAGRPVLISDQTPWRNLPKRKAGWDLPLDNKNAFTAALQQAIDLDQATYNEWSIGAWQYVKDQVQQSDLKTAYYKLFS